MPKLHEVTNIRVSTAAAPASYASVVKYRILGSVELCVGGMPTGAGGPRQVALLAMFLVNANRALSVDRLIDALWDQERRAGALKRLRVAIARLRRALDGVHGAGESVLRTVAGGYLLDVRPGELDAQVFQAQMQNGCRALAGGETALAHALLVEALNLWRGPALAEVGYEEFAQPEIRRLEELHLTAVEARIEADQRLGDHATLVGELEALVAVHPDRERLTGQLMLALYRCGRQRHALEVYARTRAYLSADLGLEPGPALQALQADILVHSPALQPRRAQPGSRARAAVDIGRIRRTSVEREVITALREENAELRRLNEILKASCEPGGRGRAGDAGGTPLDPDLPLRARRHRRR